MESEFMLNDEWLETIRSKVNALHARTAALQAKCERYEAAFKEILKQRDYYSVIELADKALSVEGEKEIGNG